MHKLLASDFATPRLLQSHAQRSTSHSETLVVKQDVLHSGVDYTFVLEATDKLGATGATTRTISVNAPPSFGRCDVEPKEGISLQTEFTFSAMDWRDEESDLEFLFAYARVRSK